MYKKLFLSLMALSAVCGLSAKHLSPQEALSRAVTQQAIGIVKAPAAEAMTMSRTINTSDNIAAIYIFEGKNGGIVVSADDRIAPVLGYLDNTAEGQLPPQAEWWLSQYVRQIEYLLSQPETATGLYIKSPEKTTATERTPIAPMTKTRWNQDDPYNYSCPTVGGQKAMTGCVATAAAQIMKYHRYPQAGVGTISYKDGATTRTLALDGKNLDWDNMLDSYYGSFTTAQRDAVAFLMQAVGYASNMSYSPYASGAHSAEMTAGIKKYFGYNEKMTVLERNTFPLAEWEDIIYDHLQTVGPVYYAGDDNIQGGHAFVCDGYSQDGFFHFNWGWGGMYDGYFKLTALTPEGQGIGGNAGGFNFGQEIVINFTKPDAQTIAVPERSPMLLTGNLTATKKSATSLTLTSDQAPTQNIFLYNNSGNTIEIDLGLKAVNETTGEETVKGTNSSGTIGPNQGFISRGMSIPNGLTNGKYRIYLMTRNYPDGEWLEVNHAIGCVNYVNVTITNGAITAVSNATGSKIEAAALEVKTSVYMGMPLKISYKLQNSGDDEVYDGMFPVIFTVVSGRAVPKAMGDAFVADLLPGEYINVETIANMYPYDGQENFKGSANLGLVSDRTGEILVYVPVTVNAAGTTKITCTEFSVVGDKNNVDANNISFNCGVKVTAGYWASPLSVYICSRFSGEMLQSINSPETYFLNQNETASATISGSFPAGKKGTTYAAVLGYISGQYIEDISNTTFKIGTAYSGIEEVSADNDGGVVITSYRNAEILAVEADTAIADVEVWSIDGRRQSLNLTIDDTHAEASLSNAPAGLLLVKVTLANGIVTTEKIVK